MQISDALIISDIHLGSDNCEAKLLTHFLEDIEDKTRLLILNGDIFDSIDFRRLKKHHWNVLSKLRKISDKIKVIWIRGNHDGTADLVSHLLGVEVENEYIFQSGNKKILVFHGDKYDKYTTEQPWLCDIADWIYRFLQKIDSTHHLARMAKHSSKKYAHCGEKIMEGALQDAKKFDCDLVVCGHTHHAIDKYPYYNSGCWTEKPCHYLEVYNGSVTLKEYPILIA